MCTTQSCPSLHSSTTTTTTTATPTAINNDIGARAVELSQLQLSMSFGGLEQNWRAICSLECLELNQRKLY